MAPLVNSIHLLEPRLQFCDTSYCYLDSPWGILATRSTTRCFIPSGGPDVEAPKVALLIETSRAYCRGLLLGINGYLRTRPWSIYLHTNDLGAPPPKWLRNWNGDGVLARIEDREMAETIRQTGLPAVDPAQVLQPGLSHQGGIPPTLYGRNAKRPQ